MPDRKPLIDKYKRQISYLRLSITDRCDLRCTYCMSEKMKFLPKSDLLTLEELIRVSEAFIERGVRKIRITGGEPLVRKGLPELLNHLGKHVGTELDELALTTNATQLTRFATEIADAGVKRLNISLDSLDPATFFKITRGGDLSAVLAGIDAALDAGLKLKINTVALKHDN